MFLSKIIYIYNKILQPICERQTERKTEKEKKKKLLKIFQPVREYIKYIL